MIVAEARGTPGSGMLTATAVHPGEREAVLPHLDVAYRLARWLVGSESEAEQIVLESARIAVLRAGARAGGASRAWFLGIVSDVCTNRGWRVGAARHSDEASPLEDAIWSLPGHLREVVVLRELEGLSTEELGEVVGVPAAAVPSLVSRARLAMAGVLFARPLTNISSRRF